MEKQNKLNLKLVKTNKMKLADYNPRIHDDKFLEKLENSINEFGYVEPIIWNEKTGNIIGGHARYKILSKTQTEIEVIVVNIEEKKEKVLNIALNKVSGDWDFDILANLMIELDQDGVDLEMTGFDPDEVEKLTGFDEEEDEIPILEDETTSTSFDFIINCSDVEQMAELQNILGVNKQEISFSDFIDKFEVEKAIEVIDV